MTLNENKKKEMQTCMHSCDNISYMLMNLVGEVGEFSSKVAKGIRKNEYLINGQRLTHLLSSSEWKEREAELMAEAGDILWQLSGLCKVMGWNLEQVAKGNLEKLASRAKRGKIVGDGDNR